MTTRPAFAPWDVRTAPRIVSPEESGRRVARNTIRTHPSRSMSATNGSKIGAGVSGTTFT